MLFIVKKIVHAGAKIQTRPIIRASNSCQCTHFRPVNSPGDGASRWTLVITLHFSAARVRKYSLRRRQRVSNQLASHAYNFLRRFLSVVLLKLVEHIMIFPRLYNQCGHKFYFLKY